MPSTIWGKNLKSTQGFLKISRKAFPNDSILSVLSFVPELFIQLQKSVAAIPTSPALQPYPLSGSWNLCQQSQDLPAALCPSRPSFVPLNVMFALLLECSSLIEFLCSLLRSPWEKQLSSRDEILDNLVPLCLLHLPSQWIRVYNKIFPLLAGKDTLVHAFLVRGCNKISEYFLFWLLKQRYCFCCA